MNKNIEELYRKLILEGNSISALNIFVKLTGLDKPNKELIKRKKTNEKTNN